MLDHQLQRSLVGIVVRNINPSVSNTGDEICFEEPHGLCVLFRLVLGKEECARSVSINVRIRKETTHRSNTIIPDIHSIVTEVTKPLPVEAAKAFALPRPITSAVTSNR